MLDIRALQALKASSDLCAKFLTIKIKKSNKTKNCLFNFVCQSLSEYSKKFGEFLCFHRLGSHIHYCSNNSSKAVILPEVSGTISRICPIMCTAHKITICSFNQQQKMLCISIMCTFVYKDIIINVVECVECWICWECVESVGFVLCAYGEIMEYFFSLSIFACRLVK